MRFFSTVLILFSLFGFSKFAEAQFDISGGSGRGAILFSRAFMNYDLVNIGVTDTQPYTVKAWASHRGQNFDPSEIILNVDYPPLSPGATQVIGFVFTPPLIGDNRALSEIVGSTYFARICVEVGGVEQICQDYSDVVIPPDPVRPTVSRGDSSEFAIIDYTVETRNGEIPFEFLSVGWIDRALDNSLVPRVGNPEIEVEIPLSELTLLEDGDNQKRYRILFESTPGVPGSFIVRQCDSDVVGRFVCGARQRTAAEIGYRRAIAQATQGGLDGRIRVEWPRFALNALFNAYIVTRCDAGGNNSRNCVTTKVLSTGPTEVYEDFTAERGQEYIYTVDVCEGLNTDTCVVDQYPNIAQSLTAFVGLVDEFEDDDTPAQATLVTRDTIQLHSFDSSSDDDWIKLSLAKPGRILIETLPFANEQVDTVLSLYNEQVTEIVQDNDDADPENAPGSFSEIETEVLPAGVYFLRVAHFELPGGEFPASTANNYLLSVKFLDADVNMAPIIHLLLLGDD